MASHTHHRVWRCGGGGVRVWSGGGGCVRVCGGGGGATVRYSIRKRVVRV